MRFFNKSIYAIITIVLSAILDYHFISLFFNYRNPDILYFAMYPNWFLILCITALTLNIAIAILLLKNKTKFQVSLMSNLICFVLIFLLDPL